MVPTTTIVNPFTFFILISDGPGESPHFSPTTAVLVGVVWSTPA
jgi:hypothetical protein